MKISFWYLLHRHSLLAMLSKVIGEMSVTRPILPWVEKEVHSGEIVQKFLKIFLCISCKMFHSLVFVLSYKGRNSFHLYLKKKLTFYFALTKMAIIPYFVKFSSDSLSLSQFTFFLIHPLLSFLCQISFVLSYLIWAMLLENKRITKTTKDFVVTSKKFIRYLKILGRHTNWNVWGNKLDANVPTTPVHSKTNKIKSKNNLNMTFEPFLKRILLEILNGLE